MDASHMLLSPQLQPQEYEGLLKLLSLHYAYPLPYPLSGGYFEELFAAAVQGEREPRKLLFDVLRGEVGWSLKTLQVTKTTIGSQFEVVVQRCDILRDRKLTMGSPVELLGERIVMHFNQFIKRSVELQKVNDTRAGFLLRNAQEREFVFFQLRYAQYRPEDVQWRWANDGRKSLMGFFGWGIDTAMVSKWYSAVCRLFNTK